jgi:chromosome segregation ATPase
MRALFDATGKTFSPNIVRRLMDVYAPGRRPSTDTLADEKRLLDEALAQEAVAGRQIDEQGGEELETIVRRAVAQALANTPVMTRQAATENLLADAQRDFLHDRLQGTEAQLADVRGQAARLAAELNTTQAQRANLQQQLATAQATIAGQEQRLQRLTDEIAGIRNFSLAAVDGVRGETRSWQDRCASLEAKLIEDKKHLEYFRQIAYARGAAVPEALRGLT